MMIDKAEEMFHRLIKIDINRSLVDALLCYVGAHVIEIFQEHPEVKVAGMVVKNRPFAINVVGKFLTYPKVDVISHEESARKFLNGQINKEVYAATSLLMESNNDLYGILFLNIDEMDKKFQLMIPECNGSGCKPENYGVRNFEYIGTWEEYWKNRYSE